MNALWIEIAAMTPENAKPISTGIRADQMIIMSGHHHAHGALFLVAAHGCENTGRQYMVEVVQMDDVRMERL